MGFWCVGYGSSQFLGVDFWVIGFFGFESDGFLVFGMDVFKMTVKIRLSICLALICLALP